MDRGTLALIKVRARACAVCEQWGGAAQARGGARKGAWGVRPGRAWLGRCPLGMAP